VLQLVAADAVWHVNGRGPFAGEHAGRAAVAQLLAGRSAQSSGTYGFAVSDVHAGDEHVVVVREVSMELPSAYRGDAVTVLHVEAGMVTAAWEYDFEPRDADAAWSSPAP
jgi:uncharacterized protein